MDNKRINIIHNMFIELAKYNLSFEFFNHNSRILTLYQTYRNIIEKIYIKNPNLLDNNSQLFENKDTYFYKKDINLFQSEVDFKSVDTNEFNNILLTIKNDDLLKYKNPKLIMVNDIIKSKLYKKIIKDCKSEINKIFILSERNKDFNPCGGDSGDNTDSIHTSSSDGLLFSRWKLWI